jgi:putative peptidoglycan lipid II flippase
VAAATGLGSLLLLNVGLRVVGLTREVIVSSRFGSTSGTDAYYLAQQVPLLLSSFMLGAFMIVFVPAYGRQPDLELQYVFVRWVTRRLLAVSIALTGATVSLGVVAQLFGRPPLGEMVLVMAIAIPPTAIWGVGYGILQARGSHHRAAVAASLAPILMLGAFLAVTAVLPQLQEDAISISFVLGSIGAALVCLPVVRSGAGWSTAAAQGGAVIDGKRFARDLAHAGSESLGYNVNQSVIYLMANASGAGAASSFAYATRIALFGLGAVVSPLGQVIQTRWVRTKSFWRSTRSLLAVYALIVTGMALSLAAAGDWVVTLVYRRGNFSQSDATQVAALLLPFAVYLVVLSTSQLLARFAFAVERGPLFVRITLVGYSLSIVSKTVAAGSRDLSTVIWTGAAVEALFAGIGVAVLVLPRMRPR